MSWTGDKDISDTITEISKKQRNELVRDMAYNRKRDIERLLDMDPVIIYDPFIEVGNTCYIEVLTDDKRPIIIKNDGEYYHKPTKTVINSDIVDGYIRTRYAKDERSLMENKFCYDRLDETIIHELFHYISFEMNPVESNREPFRTYIEEGKATFCTNIMIKESVDNLLLSIKHNARHQKYLRNKLNSLDKNNPNRTETLFRYQVNPGYTLGDLAALGIHYNTTDEKMKRINSVMDLARFNSAKIQHELLDMAEIGIDMYKKKYVMNTPRLPADVSPRKLDEIVENELRQIIYKFPILVS